MSREQQIIRSQETLRWLPDSEPSRLYEGEHFAIIRTSDGGLVWRDSRPHHTALRAFYQARLILALYQADLLDFDPGERLDLLAS